MKSEELYLIINPSRFNYLKNILEGYDGLAILSSIDSKKGRVRLKFSSQSRRQIFSLIAAISGDIKQV